MNRQSLNLHEQENERFSMTNQISAYQFWFVTGSQHLYGPETLREVGRTQSRWRRA